MFLVFLTDGQETRICTVNDKSLTLHLKLQIYKSSCFLYCILVEGGQIKVSVSL